MSETRSKWRHHKDDRYVPVFGDFFGNPTSGYHHEWSLLGGYNGTLSQAMRAGFKAQGSDDFNIAVVRGNRQVVALLWMDEDMDEEAYVLREIEEALWGGAEGDDRESDHAPGVQGRHPPRGVVRPVRLDV